MTSKLIVAAALCALVGCKKKQPDAQPDKGSAPPPVVDAAAAPVAIDAPVVVDAAPANPTADVKLDLPEGWDRMDEPDGGKIELLVPTNETKFPVDNALFTFAFGPVAGAGAPTDAAKFGEWHAESSKDKLTRTEKLGEAHYYAFANAWLVVAKVGDQLWQCGGSHYKDADYNKIPKLRDEALAAAKKICASMKR